MAFDMVDTGKFGVNSEFGLTPEEVFFGMTGFRPTPPPVTSRVFADFGPSGKSVSFQSVTPDRIVMDVWPRSGNADLPAGAPNVTNGQLNQLDFTYSAGALSSIGSGFNGHIANIRLFSGSTLLLDEPVNNADGLTYNGFSAADFRTFTEDGNDWLGDELVSNGSFDVDTSGWSSQRSATLSTDNGRLLVENGPTGFGGAAQQIALIQGATYRASCDYTFVSADGFFNVSANQSGTSTRQLPVDVQTGSTTLGDDFTATISDAYVFAAIGNISTPNAQSVFDNITVRELLQGA